MEEASGVLPKELLGVIIDFLDEISIVIAHSVCKLWNSLIAPSKLLPPSSSSSSTSRDWEYVRRLPRWSPCGLPTAMAQCGRVELIQWAVDDGWKLSVDDVVRRAAFGGNLPVLKWLFTGAVPEGAIKADTGDVIEDAAIAALSGGHFKEFVECVRAKTQESGALLQKFLLPSIRITSGAYRIEMLDYLLEIGAIQPGAEKFDPIELYRRGDMRLAEWLFEHGFFPPSLDANECRRICEAVAKGNVDELEKLKLDKLRM